jgi:hypothetical protein
MDLFLPTMAKKGDPYISSSAASSFDGGFYPGSLPVQILVFQKV